VGIVTTLLWIIQFVLGIALIVLVLVHSGRGGGLSDMFGGGLGASAAGSTVMEKNLDRITVVVALIFGFNTLIMALLINV
jgi:preprotein translocase subunit SecG